MFAEDGVAPSGHERRAYLDALARLIDHDTPLLGVLLYGLARPSMQPEAPRLSRLDAAWLNAFADEIRALGLEVRVTP
jgi:hypothetical protein